MLLLINIYKNTLRSSASKEFDLNYEYLSAVSQIHKNFSAENQSPSEEQHFVDVIFFTNHVADSALQGCSNNAQQ